MDTTTASLIPEPRYKFGSIVEAKLQTGSSFQEELEPGDIIFGVNGKTAESIQALNGLLNNLVEGSPLVVQVQRDGILRYLVLREE